MKRNGKVSKALALVVLALALVALTGCPTGSEGEYDASVNDATITLSE